MKDRDQIIQENPLKAVCESKGVIFKREAGRWKACCPFHQENHPSFVIEIKKDHVWHCFGCGAGGSVIDFVALIHGVTITEAMQQLSGSSHESAAKPKIAKIYNYVDETGKEVFQVCRLEPKSFRQRRMVGGQWVWNLEGVRRVLYNLPAVLTAERVFLVEGEKDADNLIAMGFTASCNAGGAKKWLDGYSESLTGKKIVLIPDTDEAGEAHGQLIMDSLIGRVLEIRYVRLPEGSKDISDFIATGKTAEDVEKLVAAAAPIQHKIHKQVKTMAEMEAAYRHSISPEAESESVDLGDWLPSFRRYVRRLVPGDVVSILASTGVGKTYAVQNIANSIKLPILFFELELADSLTYERSYSISHNVTGEEVSEIYKSGSEGALPMQHVYVCSEPRITVPEVERIIRQSELKIGRKPRVVIIDYIQLMSGQGKSRYERMSGIAEDIKNVAKATSAIIFLTSQVGRPEKKGETTQEVTLHDAKESGSIEQSSGLVMGMWRTEAAVEGEHAGIMRVKILKNTKGSPTRTQSTGRYIDCILDYSMRIREMIKSHGYDEQP